MLEATIVASSMAFIDASAVNIALPVVQRELNASVADLQWVVEGYTLFLSALILVGGAFGDRFGRRLIFASGLAIFTLASAACSLAPTIQFLIAARCVQGVGAALATPLSLAIISAQFSGPQRGRAIGTWSSVGTMMNALGPVLGGWVTQTFTWRAVFLINIPLGILALAVALRYVPESRDEEAPKEIDLGGAALATLGLGALVFGLIRMQIARGDLIGELCVVGGLVLLAAFVAYEHFGTRTPMVRTDLFRAPAFAGANLYTLLLYAGLSGALYFLPFNLINVQGYTPAAAGAALLPVILIIFLASTWTGGLVQRVGARLLLAAGAVCAATGFAAFALPGVGGSYWTTFFLPAVVLGIGGALFVAPLTTVVMDSARTEEAGVASGINNAVARTAGLIAIAGLGLALAGTFDTRLDTELRELRVSSGAVTVVDRLRASLLTGRIPPNAVSSQELPNVTRAIDDAYVAGFREVMLISAALAACAAVVAGFWNLRQ